MQEMKRQKWMRILSWKLVIIFVVIHIRQGSGTKGGQAIFVEGRVIAFVQHPNQACI